MTIRETGLPGVLVITPRVFRDDRGLFFESYNQGRFTAAGIDCDFRQDNVSVSKAGVIRGLHYQVPNPQAKLLQVLSGSIFDVAVDIRQGSPTFGKWVGEVLSVENRAQLFIPAGFAHGFAVLSAEAIVSYKCSTLYEVAGDATILWSDPDIAVEWPISNPLLSDKDQAGTPLRLVRPEMFPQF